MKKVLFISVALLVMLPGCNDKRLADTEMPWFEGQFADAQTAAGSDELMIFFETEW